MLRRTLVGSIIVLSACMHQVRSQAPPAKEAATPTPSYAPKPTDAALVRARAFVDSSVVAPGKLTLTGNLPTPCHELRIVLLATDGALDVQVYSVTDRGAICAQVLKPFNVDVPLTPQQARAKITVNGATAGLPER